MMNNKKTNKSKPRGRSQVSTLKRLTKSVTVKFSKPDYEKLRHRSKNANRTLAEYIRDAAFDARIVAKHSAEDAAIIRNLTGMANNLNQLTKLSHQTGFYRTKNVVMELLAKLKEVLSDYLKAQGVDDEHIIKVDLEDRRNKNLRNPDALLEYIDARIAKDGMHLLDEVQWVDEFEDVLNSYLKIPNVDVYVTGSNSKFLSSDVITEFRGRGDEIKVAPLSFSEFFSVFEGSREEAMEEYMTFGGLPMIATMQSNEEKMKYLQTLFKKTYITDILERYKIKNEEELEELINILASSIGGLINPNKVVNTKDEEGKSQRKQLEVDFVCNEGSKRCYIQSAMRLPNEEKREQELRSLTHISDSFQKFVISEGPIKRYQDENGVVFMNIYEFLLDRDSLKV